MLNKFFTFTYEVEGGKRDDTLMVWSNTISNAIEEFKNTEIDYGNGVKITYTEYAIKNIRC